MTPADFKAIRQQATMTQAELATWLRLAGFRVVQRYESGDRKIPGPVAKLMELLRDRGASW